MTRQRFFCLLCLQVVEQYVETVQQKSHKDSLCIAVCSNPAGLTGVPIPTRTKTPSQKYFLINYYLSFATDKLKLLIK